MGQPKTHTLNFARLYPDESGCSHFQPLTVDVTLKPYAPPPLPFSVSALVPASKQGFMHLPAGWVGELHRTPQRMWIFVLSGEMEIEAGDGERRRLVAGSALLLEDTEGQGHRNRVVDPEAAVFAVVHV